MRIALCLGAALAIAAIATPASAQDTSLDPTYGSVRLQAGFMPDPRTADITAGGGLAVQLGECSYGYIANPPDIDFYYDGNGANSLFIFARSASDTTILLNMPNGDWVCNDDGLGEGTNPLIVLPRAPAGLYNIWVGTYSSNTAPATLYLSEIDPR